MDGDDCTTTLDLQLGQVVESAVLRNQIAPQPILERFFQAFIERNIIMARGGALTVARLTLRSRTPRSAKEVELDLFAATR